MSKKVYISLPLGYEFLAYEGKGNSEHLYSVSAGVISASTSNMECRASLLPEYYDSEQCIDAYMKGAAALAYSLGLSVEFVDTPDEDEINEKEEKSEGEVIKEGTVDDIL